MGKMFGEVGASVSRDTTGFWWTYAKTLAAVMLCGIIGPIFLVFYFFLGDYRAQATWMLMTKLNLRIRGTQSVPTFDAVVREVVPVNAKPGLSAKVVAVQVDPNTKAFHIDWPATGIIAGTVPTRFVDDDGAIYDLTGHAAALCKILEILQRNNIDYGGVIDLQAHADVRDDILAIARRHGTRAQAATAVPADAGAQPSFSAPGRAASKTYLLADLQARYAAGQLNAAEFQQSYLRIAEGD